MVLEKGAQLYRLQGLQGLQLLGGLKKAGMAELGQTLCQLEKVLLNQWLEIKIDLFQEATQEKQPKTGVFVPVRRG